MSENNLEPSRVTKVLIHKVHGGRKKGSKFWNDNVDLSQKRDMSSIPIEGKKAIRRRVNKPIVFPIILMLSVAVVLVVARPDLFPFLEYHEVYKTIDRIDNLPLANEEPQKIQKYVQPKTYQNNKPHIPKRYKKPEPVVQKPAIKSYASNTMHNDIYSNVSLDGMVFSWLDKDGKRYFSNTNYPVDNPTLQVQTEIDTYRKITRIRVKGNQIYVPVTLINDGLSTTIWMLLDTGCSHTNVPYSTLNKINAKYGKTVYSTIADGSRKKNREAFIDTMKVGSQKERNVRVTGAQIAGSNNSGLLGLDFLKRRPFKVDYDRQMLIWM